MKIKKREQPIGIFDSGIGGLTVAHAIKKLLPNEQMIYFGDTAHLPYGDKSEAAIQAYSIRITDILLKKGCKVIVIACNSASSAAYELLQEYVNRNIHIINVIDPMVDLVTQNFGNKQVGLIGTKRTVQSGVYAKKIAEASKGITLKSLATPLLAPMIEEGFFNNQISHEIIAQYLSDAELQNIEGLILACTHYPLIKKQIDEYYNGKMSILDSSEVIAKALKTYLENENLLNTGDVLNDHFLVSDYTESFESSARLFFHESVQLEKHALWN
ncbi:glutamate racemase [Chryseosolibacter indicus]|uniref:Glutamate racemase n=1 Tax=Chryseosolibacter indicus TaxID=2782351 RepID=A0ABS5VPC7_9BACT|nr:glutamate racemase [Chryseosolibacter indicus]MBT1702719.1 glutamate racemase [Chryseosolibacter indicus]